MDWLPRSGPRTSTVPCALPENSKPARSGFNNWAVVYDETEEVGYKQSGLGRMNGVAAMDDFIEYRTFVHEVDLATSEGNPAK